MIGEFIIEAMGSSVGAEDRGDRKADAFGRRAVDAFPVGERTPAAACALDVGAEGVDAGVARDVEGAAESKVNSVVPSVH